MEWMMHVGSLIEGGGFGRVAAFTLTSPSLHCEGSLIYWLHAVAVYPIAFVAFSGVVSIHSSIYSRYAAGRPA
jgi:hypothetical protein